MDWNADIVMAVATAVSALVAVVALVVSLVSVRESNAARQVAQIARKDATQAQRKMSLHLEEIAQSRYALSARIAKGRTYHELRSIIIVENIGTDPVVHTDLKLPDDVWTLPLGNDGSLRRNKLDPGEDYEVSVATVQTTQWPVRVALSWTDSERRRHVRVQKLTRP